MRYFKLIILLSISSFTFAQTLQYINLGQIIPPNKNCGLVIKSNSKALKKLPANINSPESITAIKLIGFNEQNYSLDSLIRELKSLTNLNYIIFENCDLSALDVSLANFKNLEKIAIIKKSTFYENTFFPLLKDNKIKELCIQTNGPEIITDSLYLLAHIKSIQIGSSTLFAKSNYTTTFQIKNETSLQNIEITYYGDFYKANSTGVRTNKPAIKTQNQSPTVSYQSKFDCIKQPIPGININDTTFSFNPSQKVNFTYESGTKLIVDPNAFFNQNGTPYKGTVKLFYREFRNPVEIMLSGIPMTNNVNGETQLFKSGGMYELNAFDTENKPLTLNNDTAIKINFALTDTSQSFQYFSLNNDGSWTTVSDGINTVSGSSAGNKGATSKAVTEYYLFMKNINDKADTTNYNARFYKNEYVHTARKDNYTVYDTVSNKKTSEKAKKEFRKTANFRVKYYKLTKDKEIVFTIVPANRQLLTPLYIAELFNKKYLYQGELTKDQFKKLYNRKRQFWDLRTTTTDNTLNLDIKSDEDHQFISGKVITLKDDRTFLIHKKSAKIITQKIARLIKRETKDFNKNGRKNYGNHNNLHYYISNNKEKLAYEHCKKFQTAKEQDMSHSEWEKYAKYLSQISNSFNGVYQNNDLGNALLKSGLGFKNIDCYIHSGQMQDVFVQYKNAGDSLGQEFHTFLYKSINTSYPIYNSGDNLARLKGYYFKNKPNYIIRFSNNSIMQVSKPAEVSENKKSNIITLDYTNQFNVKGLNSDEITKLILN